MKYKKLILILSVFIIFFIYILHPYIESGGRITDGFKKEIIRFHIRANSDNIDDQDLKLKIRDEILSVMGDKFKSIDSIEESRKIIMDNLDEMKSISEKVIYNEGKNYEVDVTLGQDNFPIRKYGNMIFPQGEYETLLIEIGEAKGQNWWCVMFPPLCFVDITHSVALADDVDLEELNEFVIDETQPLKFRSLIAEKLKELLGL
ncbi:MAG: stage II sporulation protein R [Tissierellaceae bacterium]|nr:stage II sporulation protein R [Tissierellaceae bacterium]